MEKIFKIFNDSIDISVFLYYNIDITYTGGVNMKCDNVRCKYNQLDTYIGECAGKSSISSSGPCSKFEKGLMYYIGLVADSLRNKNFVDMVELMMNEDLKLGLYYVMEIYHLKFSVMEHGTCRMILLVDDEGDKGLNFKEIAAKSLDIDVCNRLIYNIKKGISPRSKVTIQESIEKKKNECKDYGKFGWLSPSGRFRPSPFGYHEESAEYIIEENGFGLDYDTWYEVKLDNGLTCLHKDFLIEVKSYVLIHDPSNSGGYVVSHGGRLTKAQREFLYNYFIQIGDRWKAEQFLEE